MNKRKIIGGILFMIGAVLILNSFSGITGFVVGDNVGRNAGSILGLVFIIGGVLVFMAGKKLEDTIEIYQDPHKKGDDSYYFKDPLGIFGNKGITTFKDFLKEANDVKDDAELNRYVREAYVGPLIKYVDEGKEHSEIAKRCLEAIGLDYEEGEIETKDPYIEEIKIAFRDWDGKMNPTRKKLLKKGDMKYVETKGKHPSVVSVHNPKLKTPISSSPGDSKRGNLNKVNDIVDLYNRIKEQNQGNS